MNICIATSTFPASPDDSAHAFFLLDVVRVLRAGGHSVSILTQARDPHPVSPLSNLEVDWFPWRSLGSRLAEQSFGSPKGMLSAASLVWSGFRAVRRMRSAGRVDLFLCAWVIPSGLYVYLDQVLSRSRTPYVLWALGSDVNKYKANPLVRRVLARIAARAGAVYADGYRLCDEVSSITGESCEFLPTFRGLPRLPPPRGHAEVPRRFLYVGRHAAVKGVDVLVDALVELKRLGDPTYRLNLVGDGDLTPALERKVKDAGLSDRVRFLGRLSTPALANAYAESDCVVIPSRSESIPLVMSEALQARLPLIVTDVGDMGDLARRFGLGEVVPPENPDALAAAIRRFIDAPWQLDPVRSPDLLRDLTFESAAPKLLRRLEALAAI